MTSDRATTTGSPTTATAGTTQAVRGRLAAAVEAGRSATPAGRRDALLAVAPAELSSLLHPQFVTGSAGDPIGSGLPASPGAASGRIALDADTALAWAEAGEDVMLVRSETTPDDVLGMQAARGVLTARGGLVSHAAVVARGWGIPAVVGVADLHLSKDGMDLGGRHLAAGDWISIDGTTGDVFAGRLQVTGVDVPPELDELLSWADDVTRDRLRIRANADNAVDAAHARRLGATGIGLCRTEHMFLAEDRLPLMRRFILTEVGAVEAACLDELQHVQRRDFVGILEAMDGLPVTVRLLDPPLHEFLPDIEPLIAAEARGELDAKDADTELLRAELTALRRLREANPMIGTRGVRLGVLKPGLYEMQVRALLEAVADRVAAGGHPSVEIMIPLVVEAREMAVARGWVTSAMSEVGLDDDAIAAVKVGAMIETPRAALTAAAIAQHADFFSFGTNDLTQLTFAFSRDDVETRLIPSYLRSGVLDANPFERLDADGVGRLIELACADGRAAKPGLTMSVCGEHAGDPESVRLLIHAGVDSLSCSPYRVPIARLAAAQALLRPATPDGGSPLTVVALSTAAASAGAFAPSVEQGTDNQLAGPHAAPEHVRFSVLHALRIKGFGVEVSVSQLALVAPEPLRLALESLVEDGAVKHLPARSMWQLTPSGRELHASLIGEFVGDRGPALRAPYEPFLKHNHRLKDLCTAWQTRADGSPNDHSDAGYDAARIADIAEFHGDLTNVLTEFAAVIDRFCAYQPRLLGALHRLQAGDPKAFTGVMCESYHDIWMELHEDLIQLLSIDRTAEGSF